MKMAENERDTCDIPSSDAEDIVIELADNMDTRTWESNIITYNLTKFVSNYLKQPEDGKHKLAQFTQSLDTKYNVDKEDERYVHLIQDMEQIFKTFSKLLSSVDKRFLNAKTYKTGSTYAGLKIGLPLETDFMLELKEECKISTEEFYAIAMKVYASDELKKEVPKGWMMHGLVEHGAGACLVLEYKQDEATENGLGASMDIVPICKVPQSDENKIKLTEQASAFLKYHNLSHLAETEIYRLCCRTESDTGLIENAILKCLDDDVKQGFRVAKFILQHCFIHGEHQDEQDLIQLCPDIAFVDVVDREKAMKLFGYKPCVSSFFLRVCLFHVVLNGFSRPEVADVLKGGVLTLCLLDMVQTFATEDITTFTNIYDVIQEDGLHTKQLWIDSETIDNAIATFVKNAMANDMSSYGSVNSEGSTYFFE